MLRRLPRLDRFVELSANGARGSLLTQNEIVANVANTVTNRELVRYLDGDLLIDRDRLQAR